MTTTHPDADDGDQEQPEPKETAPRAGAAARAVAGHLTPGLRHGWALLTHWATAGYMSDDEIRRRLVKKHLDKYEEDRETAAMHVRRLNKKAAKISSDLAYYGATHQEASRLRDMSSELNRYRNAGKVLGSLEFDRELAQPTPAQIRRVRTLRALTRFGCVVVPGAAVGTLVVVLVPMTGLIALPVLLGGAWWLGAHPVELTPRALAPELARPELAPLDGDDAQPADPDAPFPLTDDTTPAEAVEAFARALKFERQPVKSITRGRGEPWGYSMYVTYSSGGPDQINEKDTYRSVVTMLNLRKTGLLVEVDPEAGASAWVRLMRRDPFTADVIGEVPYRAPLSRSILEPADYGVTMDADPLVYSLAGVMLLMVANSGGAKSGVMLAMAEVVTACRDAVAISLDSFGTGVGALEGAITLTANGDDDRICAVLDFLLTLCTARAQLRARMKWGDDFEVSEEHPAFVVFADEWPGFSQRAKAKLVQLMMIGRKEAVWVIGGSQFGTKKHLGDAIGAKLSTKIVGPCRGVDVTELLGQGSLAEGYRADLLRPATKTDPGDAGQIYAQGLPGMDDKPLRYKVRKIPNDYAAKLGAERAAAGLPDVTHTLAEVGLLDQWRDLQGSDGQAPAGPVPAILQVIRDAFTAERDPEDLATYELLPYLRRDDAAYWGQWDEEESEKKRRALVGAALQRKLSDAGVSLRSARLPRKGKPSGYRLDDVKAAMAEMRK